MGPIIFQLPPGWPLNLGRFRAFLDALPRGRRFAFEFRNDSWIVDEVAEALAGRNCAFCIHELAGRSSPLWLTADFVYVRLHGPGRAYQGSYSDADLTRWAERIGKWRGERDVYLYFDNDQEGYAAKDALRLRALVERRKVSKPA